MKPENPKRLFPLFLVTDLDASQAFYERHGFAVVHRTDNYLQVGYGDGNELELCFMKPDAFPDGSVRPAFAGKGVIVSVPTPDADEKYQAMKRLGAKLLSEPSDKPWGWRSFFTVDPNGVVLDFFHVYKQMAVA